MSTETKLGKIKSAEFGFGGYDGAMIGLSFHLQGDSWGTGDFWGTWAHKEIPTYAEWTEESRAALLGGVAMRLAELLRQAKKLHVAQLAGTPIEATFEGLSLKSWRVLAEVL